MILIQLELKKYFNFIFQLLDFVTNLSKQV